MKEIDSVDEKIAELKEKLGDIDVTHLNRDRKRLLQQQQDLMKEVCNFYIFQGGFNFQRSQFLFIYLFLYKCIPWDLQRWIVWWNTYLILQCDLVSEVYFQWGNNLIMVWGISWVIERHNLGESEVLTMCDRTWFHLNHIGGVLVLRARLEFSRSWVQASVKSSKDYKIGICCFSVRHAVYNMSTLDCSFSKLALEKSN